jgi:hypothetical protein
MFAESPDTLAEFGMTAPKKAERSAAVKAGAVAKNKATRVARHTMGKNQKKAVKGAVNATLVVAPVDASKPSGATATPAVPAPQAAANVTKTAP